MKLPGLAPGVGCNEHVDDFAGASSLTQQPHAVDAVIGIDQRLRRDRAEAGGDIGHTRADGEEFCRNSDAELAGGIVSGDDRPGHLSPFSVSMILSENRFPLFRIMLYRPAA